MRPTFLSTDCSSYPRVSTLFFKPLKGYNKVSGSSASTNFGVTYTILHCYKWNRENHLTK